MSNDQNWNNVLNYIKRNLGASVNLIELSDNDIISGLKEDVLPEFSQYIPHKEYCQILQYHQLPFQSGYSRWRYTIPVPAETYIINIEDVYINNSSHNSDIRIDEGIITNDSSLDNFQYYSFNPNPAVGENLIDAVIANALIDANKYINGQNTWEYIPPNIMMFDYRIGSAIVVYNVVHRLLSTIPSDYYHTVFKKFCLATVKRWLIAIRSKYENISTPTSQITINWQKLEDDYNKEMDDVMNRLNTTPAHQMVYIF